MLAALGPRGPAAIRQQSSARSFRRLPTWLHQTQRRAVTIFQLATPHSAEEAAAQDPTSSSTTHSPNAPEAATASAAAADGDAIELSKTETARRKKISEANAGRVPWNKGRKHSPETIAKIKARTEEAMKRPEIQQNFRMAMEKRVQVHSEETKAKIGAKVREYLEQKRESEGLPPKPPKPPKAPRAPKAPKAPRSEAEEEAHKQRRKPRPTAGGDADGAAGQEPAPKKPRVQKPKAPALNEDGTPAEPPEKKKRKHNSEEHKQAIRDAIKAKWADPEFKQFMREKMKEGMAKRGIAPVEGGTPRKRPAKKASGTSTSTSTSRTSRSRSSTGSGSSGAGSGSSGGGSALSQSKQQQVWLLQVQTVVDTLLQSQKMIESMDQNMESMQKEAGAFVNDPVMLDRLSTLMARAADGRQTLACRVVDLQAKIPANVGFDSNGRVFIKPKPSASSRAPPPSASSAPAPEEVAGASSTQEAAGGGVAADARSSASGAEEELSALSSTLGNQGAFYRLSPGVEAPAGIRVSWDMAGPELREAVGR